MTTTHVTQETIAFFKETTATDLQSFRFRNILINITKEEITLNKPGSCGWDTWFWVEKDFNLSLSLAQVLEEALEKAFEDFIGVPENNMEPHEADLWTLWGLVTTKASKNLISWAKWQEFKKDDPIVDEIIKNIQEISGIKLNKKEQAWWVRLYIEKDTNIDMEEFLRAYLECLIWQSTDDAGEPIVGDEGDLCEKDIEKCREDCEGFISLAKELLEDYKAGQAGHDFCLSRNRHGAGFFDSGHKNAEELQELAVTFGPANVLYNEDEEAEYSLILMEG